MIQVVIGPGDKRLSVKLTFDLSEYCPACKIMYRLALETNDAIKARVAACKESAVAARAVAAGEEGAADKVRIAVENEATTTKHEKIATAKESTAETETGFPERRKALLLNFPNFEGAVHWKNIKKELSKQCNKKDPNEAWLAKVLGNPTSSIEGPHIITSLDNSFIELLKNSTDAVLKKYAKGESDNMVLEMKIELELKERDILAFVTDNAGGFPSAYLESFGSPQTIDADRPTTEQKIANRLFLGGKGQGLVQLQDLVYDAIFPGSGDLVHRTHSVPPGSTSMLIRNNSSGAVVELKSPIAPLLPHVEEKKPASASVVNRTSISFGSPGAFPWASSSGAASSPSTVSADSDSGSTSGYDTDDEFVDEDSSDDTSTSGCSPSK